MIYPKMFTNVQRIVAGGDNGANPEAKLMIYCLLEINNSREERDHGR